MSADTAGPGSQQPVDRESASDSKHGFESIMYGVEKLDGDARPHLFR
jgi:hypothetical protein